MMTAKNYEKMTSSELVELYNSLNPEKPVKKFRDKSTAIARVVALVEAQQPRKKQGVGLYAKTLLLEKDPALSYKEILKKVLEKFPTAETSIKCLGWYATQLRSQGYVLPDRPRSSYK